MSRYSIVASVRRSISAPKVSGSSCLQLVRGGLIGRAAARDHVGRHGPGRACEADQRRLLRQFAGQDAHGLVDGREMLVDVVLALERRHPLGPGDRRQPRPLAGDEPQVGPQRVGDQQDVGEENRGVEPVAADRLQRDFGGQFGIVAQRQEIPGLGPRRAVFRQVAPGLPHQPDGRHLHRLARQRTQELFLAGGGRVKHGNCPSVILQTGIVRDHDSVNPKAIVK
jgi:hypothetical protein